MHLNCSLKIEELDPDKQADFVLEVPDEADEDEIEKRVHARAVEILTEQVSIHWELQPEQDFDYD